MNRWHIAAAVVGALLIATTPALGQPGETPDLLAGAPGGQGQKLLFSGDGVPSHLVVAPGQTFQIAVVLSVGDGWVFYSPSPGGGLFTPMPATLTVDAGSWQVGPALWPADREHDTPIGDTVVKTFVYTGRVVAYLPVTVPADASAGRQEIRLKVTGQVCAEMQFKCVPVRAETTVAVAVGPAALPNAEWTDPLRAGLASAVPAEKLRPEAPASAPAATAASPLSVWGGLGLAVLAGLILNVMPCVLPVIPVRILSVVELARQSRRRFVTVGLAFAAGVALLFVGLAAANVVLHHTAGRALDWGRHFQSAPFRLGMAMVVVAMAANLFGVFTVFVP
ncbi:MAG: hypothetical protein MUP47_09390, partial [Phycisphaerae bacterium]|nr:hypothetical protein [Phycisphaerae bacterium]